MDPNPFPGTLTLNKLLVHIMQAREQATAAANATAVAVQAAAAAATTAAANQVAASTAAAIAAARLGMNNNDNNNGGSNATNTHTRNTNAGNVNTTVTKGITGKKRASESRPAERALETLRHATLTSTTHDDEDNDEYSMAFLDESTSQMHRDTSQLQNQTATPGSNAHAHTYPKGRGR